VSRSRREEAYRLEKSVKENKPEITIVVLKVG